MYGTQKKVSLEVFVNEFSYSRLKLQMIKAAH